MARQQGLSRKKSKVIVFQYISTRRARIEFYNLCISCVFSTEGKALAIVRWRRLGAAIGVVGNPSLRPAFRVRRGRERKNGFAASRAHRATRPTPSEFRRQPGGCADFKQPASVLGHSLAVRIRPALSRLAVARARELGNTLGVGRGRQMDQRSGQGSVVLDGKHRRRAHFRYVRSRRSLVSFAVRP